jgi:formylglycine-generating enzyme
MTLIRGDGEHLARRVPLAEPQRRRLRRNVSGRKLRAERVALYDMCGNVWEWTTDAFTPSHAHSPCCAPELLPGERFPRNVIKGGSQLCAPNYCLRYRPAARQGETIDTSTSHIGFRCVVLSSRGE